MNRLLSLLLLIIALPAFAQTAEFDKILFPVISYFPTGGALGSRWVTDVSVLNAGSTPIALSGSFACFTCFTAPKLPPGVTIRMLPNTQTFLLVEKGRANDIKATVRIHDLSRDASTAGAEVPIAREADFSATRIDLLGIPADVRFRRTLRIYSFDPVDADVAIRELVEAEESILSGITLPVPFADTPKGETVVHLTAPDNRFAFWETRPAYAEVTSLPASTSGTARLEIRPLTPGARIWAFLSLTNNETQAVTIIMPR